MSLNPYEAPHTQRDLDALASETVGQRLIRSAKQARDMVADSLTDPITATRATDTGAHYEVNMTDTNLKGLTSLTQSQTAWYSSNNEEIWSGGPYDTREEAEAEAEANEHRLIMPATKRPIRISKFFDQESFLEQAEESLYDLANEDGDPILDFHPDVKLDLQARVRAAIDEWQVVHQLSPVGWRFDSSDPVEIAAWAKGGDA